MTKRMNDKEALTYGQQEKGDEIIEPTEKEPDEILSDEDLKSGDGCEEIRSFYFSDPAPYVRVEPRPQPRSA